MRKSLLLLSAASFLFLFSNKSYSQIDEIGSLLTGGKEDGEKLLVEYLTPYANALGADLSGGWYNTAKVHKLGGFDLTFTVNMAMVPDADKYFNLNEIGLSDYAEYSGIKTPTVAGEEESGPEITYYEPNTNQKIVSYNAPEGTGIASIPAPMVQLGIGLVKETEIIGRFLPSFDIGKTGSSVGLWGIGIKHSLKQYIPGVKNSPVFHLSFLGGYTQLKTNSELSVLPQDIEEATDLTNGEVDFENQEMNLEVNSYTFNLIASANLPVISFYGGIGLSITKMDLDLNGNYPLPVYDVQLDQVVIEADNILVDPIHIAIKNTDGSTTNPRLNIGMRLKMGPITLHGDYTYANYSVITAGFGLSIR